MLFKRLSPRTLFSLTPSSSPSPYSIFIAQYSSSSPTHPVSVWWDLESCNVPSGVNVFGAAQAITAAIKSSGMKGPIELTAFGDMVRLSRTNPEAYHSTLISFPVLPFSHVTPDEKNNALRRDLMRWVLQNPTPAHVFLITGDITFSPLLHHLRMQNYNVLLASKEPVHCVLRSAATIWWSWDALVKEENLTGRYFNKPPGSWYGH